jgi:hypothetical protein
MSNRKHIHLHADGKTRYQIPCPHKDCTVVFPAEVDTKERDLQKTICPECDRTVYLEIKAAGAYPSIW